MPAEGNLFLILFFAGFTAGVLFMNVWWNMQNSAAEAKGLYAMASFLDRDLENDDYFRYLCRCRGSLGILAALSGITIFGVPAAVTGIMGLGIFMGAVLTLGLLEVGLKGAVLVLGFLFPHFAVYVPVAFSMGMIVYRISLKGWKSMVIPASEYKKSLLSLLLLLLVYGVGILLEAYVNPWFVTFIIKKLKIF